MADAEVCGNCGAERAAGAECPRCRPIGTPEEKSSVEAVDVRFEASDVTVDQAPAGVVLDATGEWSDVPDGPTKPAPAPRANALPAGSSVPYFGDFELVRELGRGGMGVVYEARQVSLNRAVALKMIKAGVLAGQDELRRFHNEAEAVAMLDHPGIVSAFEVGEHDGQHYLAMQLVRGESLLALLKRYNGDPRATATLVAEAAEAVSHAHSRGILHRDLKPANILVDADGRPHITDFGLARRIEDDLEMTASGAILGTPAYMAPEQAGGHRSAITTATDVYGLGSVLYALLSGRPPFKTDSILETLDALRGRPPEAPSKLNAKVPRDLETICLKCLEKDPKRRYASAQALADDLRAWLGSRPISARRVGVLERSWLWCKRRPGVAAATATAVFAVIGGVAAVIAIQASANHALRGKNSELAVAYRLEAKANANLAAANAKVEQRYNLAMDAIRTFHTGVSEDFLLKEPKFRALRDRLLDSAGDFYQKLGRDLQAGDDDASRRAVYGSNFELAELSLKLGRKAEALDLHRRVLEGREALANAPGATPKAKIEAGRSMQAMIAMLKATGNTGEVPALLARALAFHETLAAERPSDPDAQEALASMLVVQGDQLKNVERKRAEAEAVLRRSLAILDAVAKAHPDEPKYGYAKVGPLLLLSYLRADEGKYAEATQFSRQVLDLRRKELEGEPRNVRIRSGVAGIQELLAAWSRAAQRLDEATEFARAARDTWRQIVAEQPAVAAHRKSLSTAQYGLAMTLESSGKSEQAAAELREGIAIQTKLAEEEPNDRELRLIVTDFHASLGYVLLQMRRIAEAEAEYRIALAGQEKLAVDEPSHHGLLDSIGISHMNLGRVMDLANRPLEAAAEFRAAIAVMEKLVIAQPAQVDYRARPVTTRSFLASALRKAGRLSEAEAVYRDAMADARALAESTTGTPQHHDLLASFHTNRGEVLLEMGRPAEAVADYDRAIAIRERLIKEYPKAPSLPGNLAWTLRRRGLALDALGDAAGSAASTRRALDLLDALPSRQPYHWFETACARARLGLPDALATLRKALDLGYNDLYAIRNDRGLNPLRDRPEFRMLLQDRAFPADPFAP